MTEENHSLMTLKSPRSQHFFLFVRERTTECKFSKWIRDKSTFSFRRIITIFSFHIFIVESVKRKH